MLRHNIFRAAFFVILTAVTCVVAADFLLAQTSGELSPGDELDKTQVYGPGDVKDGYESADYITRSLSLLDRRGSRYDLIEFALDPPLGLPALSIPENNPLTREKIDLGRKLFFDRRLSINNTFSCAVCHVPEQGFTNNELNRAVGVEGRAVLRNSPTIYNVAYQRFLFFDGREFSLENQVWQPITSHNEMAAPSIGYVINKIHRIDDYEGLFEVAFNGRKADILTIGQALASYQRTLLSANSPFDQWYFGGDDSAASESAKRGFAVFAGKGGCAVCHQVNEKSSIFADHKFHNTGLGYSVSEHLKQRKGDSMTRVQLAPGVFTAISQETIDSITRTESPNDLGLYRVTENPNDRWKFRTPTLRNVALTSPYMHNGQFQTLREVIEFYNIGGIPNELLSPLIRPLGLSDSEKLDLEAFLHSLTGSNVAALVADAFAAPIGELSEDDPNWAHDKTLGY